MRLKPADVLAILKGLDEATELSFPYELFLFGSRADDNKLGGDIDLLLVIPASELEQLAAVKHRLITQAKKYIADQRLDLTIRAKEKLQDDPFFRTIEQNIVRLR